MSRSLPALAATTLGLLLSAGEVGLRVAGYRPWSSLRTNPVEPTLHDPDSELGWTLRPRHREVRARWVARGEPDV